MSASADRLHILGRDGVRSCGRCDRDELSGLAEDVADVVVRFSRYYLSGFTSFLSLLVAHGDYQHGQAEPSRDAAYSLRTRRRPSRR